MEQQAENAIDIRRYNVWTRYALALNEKNLSISNQHLYSTRDIDKKIYDARMKQILAREKIQCLSIS